MFAQFSTRLPALGRERMASFRRRLTVLGPLGVLCLAAAACSAPPSPPFGGPDPSDPRARVPRAAYSSTVAPYTSQRPVEPRPWLEQNRRVAPAEKP
jgi:hypothetical protein